VRTVLALLAAVAALAPDLRGLPSATPGGSTPRLAAADANVPNQLFLGGILGFAEDIEEGLDPDDPPVRTEQDAPDRDGRAVAPAFFGREPAPGRPAPIGPPALPPP
jgi:hypothetical protein